MPPTSLSIAAIDVHAHYGDYTSDSPQHTQWCMTGDAATVIRRAREANIEFTIASPLLGLMPRGQCDAFVGNEEAARVVPQTPGLLQYAIVNPLQPRTFDQAREMMKARTCVGLKWHPEEHRYPLPEHAEKLFAHAAELRAVVKVHSGEQFSMPDDYVRFANNYPEATIILAHIGCGYNGDRTLQARAVQKSKHGNVVCDSSSAMSILPRNIEWAVQQIGADKVCFGTDTPLYHAGMQRARIDYAELSDADKRLILRDNAVRIFGAKLAPFVTKKTAVATATV